MQFTFFNKKVQHKRFDYSPMYYDERKERLELKKAEYSKLATENLSAEERQAILRQNMQTSWSRSQHASKAKSSSNIRIVILIAVMLLLGYFIFSGLDEVDVVVKKIM
ncbi:MAG: hypothetical protein NWQ47_00595 [Crocinitomicaceae bacterium]|nr:hypothetical protein [Crocinitomicaceae bacterium]